MINVATPNRVLIAVSSGPAITSTSSFNFFQFQHDQVGPTPNRDTGGFADFPSLGVDNNALYIGVNVFNGAGTSFLGSTGFVVQKSALLSGSLTVTAFRQLVATSTGSGPYAPRGVSNDDPSATEGYFIGADNASFGRLTIRRITNPGGVPTISGNLGITVRSTFYPANVPAKGSSSPLDALDDRLFSALMKNGSLWTAHNIGTDATGTASSTPSRRTSMRWYEITGLTSTPALNQSGTLFDPSTSNPKYYWVGSVATSGQGHMALGSSYAGAADFAGVALTGRLATDPLGTLGVPTLIPSSTSYNVPQSGSPQRWGDYSFTAVDPTDDMTMWTVQEICNATNSWGVLVTHLVAPRPALPSSAAPSTVSAGTSPDVVVTGTSASGSGFFDPGPGFPNHIAATVNGSGVVVNSVTYTGPTSITLHLSVAANAPAGARTITLTNPDGQSATSASGILTVVQNRASTTTTLASSPNPSTFGQSVNFTATVSSGSGTPTGAVAFFDGATNIGSGALNGSGQATLSTAMLAVGSHSITASYGGDANFNTSTSSALTQVVKRASTTTVVTSSANPSVSGQSVAFTATVAVVSPGAGTPSGSVTFKDGAAVLGTGTLNAGSARFTTSSLSIGSHSITAAYSGDPNFVGSTSAKLIQKVDKIPTTTTLSSSLNPSTFGQRVQFTATVSSGSRTPPNGEAVRFKDGSTVLGTGSLSGGKASFSTSSLKAGSHSINAIYAGDANFKGSSGSLTQVVRR
jgi:hypothetical protein